MAPLALDINAGPATMTRQWQTLSYQDASRHALFGVRGWPLVFAASLWLDLLRTLAPLAEEAASAGMTLVQFLDLAYPELAFAKLLLAINSAAAVLISCLLLIRQQRFRPVAVALLVGSWPAAAAWSALKGGPGLEEALGQSVLPWLISCVVWVTYLQRSRQVRVTFENCVLAGEGGSAPLGSR